MTEDKEYYLLHFFFAKNGQNVAQTFRKWHKKIRFAKMVAKEKYFLAQTLGEDEPMFCMQLPLFAFVRPVYPYAFCVVSTLFGVQITHYESLKQNYANEKVPIFQ